MSTQSTPVMLNDSKFARDLNEAIKKLDEALFNRLIQTCQKRVGVSAFHVNHYEIMTQGEMPIRLAPLATAVGMYELHQQGKLTLSLNQVDMLCSMIDVLFNHRANVFADVMGKCRLIYNDVSGRHEVEFYDGVTIAQMCKNLPQVVIDEIQRHDDAITAEKKSRGDWLETGKARKAEARRLAAEKALEEEEYEWTEEDYASAA